MSTASWKLVCILLLAPLLAACSQIAVMTTPKKKPIPSHNPLAKKAEKKFWYVLHHGEYHQISPTLKLLTAAYLLNPNDPKLAAHLAFTHIWKIAERRREKEISPLIVNHIVLANKFFSDAHELSPNDARYHGFLGVSQLVEGKIFNDEREQTRGYFTLKSAIFEWPQFNYFTAGYPMSILPVNSKLFKKAVNWQWKTLDICIGKKINRNNPDYSPYMKLETHVGRARACWNSWIAPYNFEGFFLNMGDMLVKEGKWQVAKIIYNNAKLAKNYKSWPYRHALELRIQHARANVTYFRHEPALSASNVNPNKTMVFNTSFSCMMCHQKY